MYMILSRLDSSDGSGTRKYLGLGDHRDDIDTTAYSSYHYHPPSADMTDSEGGTSGGGGGGGGRGGVFLYYKKRVSVAVTTDEYQFFIILYHVNLPPTPHRPSDPPPSNSFWDTHMITQAFKLSCKRSWWIPAG